jgi:hypothetical protein
MVILSAEGISLVPPGAYFFKTGDYAAAQNAFRMALEGAAGQPETIDWLTLQRDAALGYAMATLAGGYSL